MIVEAPGFTCMPITCQDSGADSVRCLSYLTQWEDLEEKKCVCPRIDLKVLGNVMPGATGATLVNPRENTPGLLSDDSHNS